MSLSQELGRLTGRQASYMEKDSATALVRAILRGALSPKSVTRAAAAMKPGTFRRIEQLGSGVYNKADLIVGNVGPHAGVGVRKLPTHQFVNPKQNYEGVKAEVDRINKLLPTETGVPAIAPYYHVGDRGAFQHFTGELGVQGTKSFKPPPSVWKLNEGAVIKKMKNAPRGAPPSAVYADDALKHVDDLHYGNVGPGGQIHDFVSRLDPGIGTIKHHPEVSKIDWSVPNWGAPKLPQNNWQRIVAMLQNMFGARPNLSGTTAGVRDAAYPLSKAMRWAANREVRKNTAIHKWYDAMSQAQRASTPLTKRKYRSFAPKSPSLLSKWFRDELRWWRGGPPKRGTTGSRRLRTDFGNISEWLRSRSST